MFLYFFSHSPNPYNRLYCRLPIIIIIFILDKTHHSARCSKQKRFIHATHHPTQQAFCPTHVDNAVHFFLTLFFVYPPYNIYPLNSTSFSSDRDWLNNFPTNLPTSFPFLSFSPSILLFSPKRKQLLVLSFCFPFSLFSFSSHQPKNTWFYWFHPAWKPEPDALYFRFRWYYHYYHHHHPNLHKHNKIQSAEDISQYAFTLSLSLSLPYSYPIIILLLYLFPISPITIKIPIISPESPIIFS